MKYPITACWDKTKILGYVELLSDTILTAESLIVPGIQFQTFPPENGPRLTDFALIDRNGLMSKKEYRKNYKEIWGKTIKI